MGCVVFAVQVSFDYLPIPSVRRQAFHVDHILARRLYRAIIPTVSLDQA